MFLPQRLYHPLAEVDDAPWQSLLGRHTFWQDKGVFVDAEHQDLAFHILLSEGQLARAEARADSAYEFDAVPVPDEVFADAALCDLVQGWAGMHASNYGPGLTVKLGLYVIRAGGTLGFHIDGPVFLQGQRVDLSTEPVQRGLIELHASHRTILPLRFNAEDSFMLCAYRAPLRRGELFEFGNVLPHAYFNRGSQHAVLLVTTYLDEALLPAEVTYGPPVA